MFGLRIRDSAGPGISLDDVDGPVSLEFRGASLLIERAAGSGVVAHGANINGVGALFVRGTRALQDGRDGYGVALHPSALVTGGAQTFAPSTFEQAILVLEDNAGAGLLVEGSVARVARAVIMRTQENGLGESYGVLVRPRVFGDLPASLVLEDSVIEQSAGAGVFVDALPARYDEASGNTRVSVSIERVSIRNSAGAGCMGNAVRVRAGGAAEPGSDTPVLISDSLIEGAREAGIHVQGAEVRVERTIVRDTAESACGGAGDGVAVYGDERMPARLWLSRSRIENSARAGIAVFGASADVDSSAIQGCGAAAVARMHRVMPSSVDVRGSQCACAGGLAACSARELDLAPALIGGNGCNRFEGGVCWAACFDDLIQRLFNPQADPLEPLAPVEGVTAWAPDDPRLAPARSGADGCVEWGGLPENASFVAQLGRGYHERVVWGYTPVMWRQTTGDRDFVPVRSGVYTAETAAAVWAGVGETPLDLRKTPAASVVACERPDPPVAGAKPKFECFHRGIAGLRLEPVSGVSGRPYYTSEGGALEIGVVAMTRTAIGGFVNAAPGEVVMRVLPPEGSSASVRCTTDPYGDGWSMGELVAPDMIRMPARPGLLANAFVYCALE